MSKIKCVIVEEEPYAVSVLESYIGELDSLQLTATFYNPIDALMYLLENKTDVLFVDVQLPNIKGIDFLKLIPSRPQVIFLAPLNHRFVNPKESHILGCLLKPFRFELFLRYIDKCFETITPEVCMVSSAAYKPDRRASAPFIYLVSGKVVIKVFLEDILYVEGVKTCARVTTVNGQIFVHQGLAEIHSSLVRRGFLRIHRAFLVARNRITAFSDHAVEINNCILPISGHYRAKVLKTLHAGTKNV
nr:LytTR family DNA-binding domain-containing protein [uncultured Dyadobacter sp.]